MLTERNFKVPLYDYTVEVKIFDKAEEARAKFPDVIDGSMLGCTLEHIDCPRCTLLIPATGISTIIHELEHAKNLIWKYIGYKPQASNDEPDAYLLGYLFEQVEKVLKIHTKLASKY
jgi:hypothetical protein